MDYQKGMASFIVDVGEEAYHREIKNDKGETYKGHDGNELVTSTLADDWENAKMSGTVVCSAKHASYINKGDTLFFKNTITRNHNRFGDNFKLGDKGLHRVPFWYVNGKDHHEYAFAYKNDRGIHAIDGWVLVKPVTKIVKIKGLIMLPEEIDGKKYYDGDEVVLNGRGEVAFVGANEKELTKGDKVMYPEGLEYKVTIDNETYFRIPKSEILATYA